MNRIPLAILRKKFACRNHAMAFSHKEGVLIGALRDGLESVVYAIERALERNKEYYTEENYAIPGERGRFYRRPV